MIIVVDDEDRENEGDLTIAAEKVTPEAINFMARHGRGLICLSMMPDRLDELEIPLMVSQNTSRFETGFCVSIESKGRTTTGISAADRAATVRAAIDPATKPSDLARPGHMFPLRARTGGVIERAGQTEAAVDLARIAGLYPAGVICEILNDDGTMARVPQLAKVAKKHGLLMITIADLIKYRIQHRVVGETRRHRPSCRPTTATFTFTCSKISWTARSTWRWSAATSATGGRAGPRALVVSDGRRAALHPLRLRRCSSTPRWSASASEGRGVLLYLNQEGRGIGLANKIRAYELQDEGFDTVEANERLGFKADQRDYGIGVQILRELGIRSMRLLSNNPRKLVGIEGYGLSVSEWLPLEIPASDSTRRYLKTKKEKLGHKLSSV